MAKKLVRKSANLPARAPAALEEKAIVGSIDLVLGELKFGTPARSGVAVSERAAIGLTPIFSACQQIASETACAPINLLDETPSKDGRRVAARKIRRDHWAARLIENPNPWQTTFEFIEWAVFNARLFGASLALQTIVRGETRELWPVPNGSWDFEDQRNPLSRVRVVMADGTVLYRDRRDCFILSGPSIDGVSALQPIQELREAVGLAAALEIQQASSARDGGTPTGILTAPMAADKGEITKVSKGWSDRFRIGGSGGTPVLQGDWKYAPISRTSAEQQTLETREFMVAEIARAFCIPGYKLGAKGTSAYASADAAREDFYQTTIKPWLYRLEQALTRDVLRRKGARDTANLRFDCDELELMRGNQTDQSAFIASLLGASGAPQVITVNEGRSMIGYPEHPAAWANDLSMGAMNKAAQAEAAPRAGSEAPPHLPSEDEQGPQ